MDPTVDGRNPQQPPGTVLKPCKYWDIYHIKWSTPDFFHQQNGLKFQWTSALPLHLPQLVRCASLVLVRCGDSTFHWPPRSSPTGHRMLRAVGFGSKPRVFVGFLVRWNPTSRKKTKGTLPKTNMAGWKITMFNRKCRAKEKSELGNLRTCQFILQTESSNPSSKDFDSHFLGILRKKYHLKVKGHQNASAELLLLAKTRFEIQWQGTP